MPGRYDHLTSEQRKLLVEDAERRLGLRAKADAGLPGFNPNPFGALDVLQHPSGMLVHGPGSADLIRKARGQSSSNSAVLAVVGSLARAYLEPTMRCWRGPYLDVVASDIVQPHPIELFFREMNPAIPSRNLRKWSIGQLLGDGNAYFVTARGGGGSLAENTSGPIRYVWPAASETFEPVTVKGSGDFISHYEWRLAQSGRPVRVPSENVIHMRYGLDPADPRKGLGPIKSVAREVVSDEQIADLVQYVLVNAGVPGLIIKPQYIEGGGLGRIDQTTLEEIKADVNALTTGSRRGSTIALRNLASIEQFKVDFSGLDLTPILEKLEARISGVIGWPAILAGLSVGLTHATYANAEALMDFATRSALVPMWLDESEFWTQRLRDEPGFELGEDEFVAYDWPAVSALAQDDDAMWRRVIMAFSNDLITLDQAHQLLDQDLPAGVDGGLRNADIKNAASGGLPPMVKALGAMARKAPDSVAAMPSDDDLDEAVIRFNDWARRRSPGHVGLLTAEPVGD